MADNVLTWNWSGIMWYWSDQYQDFYYVTQNQMGQQVFAFYKQCYPNHPPPNKSWASAAVPNNSQTACVSHHKSRVVSAFYPYGSAQYASMASQLAGSGAYAASGSGAQLQPQPQQQSQMPEPVDRLTRSTLPNLIPGTPERGWCESLDPTYRMRTGSEAREFFRKGRVFSMLYSEAASEYAARYGADNDAVTVVRFGQSVYSQIRRFAVVAVKHGFVYACGISTYTSRGTLKPGCDPREHAIIYFTNSAPTYIQGEYESGMTKESIAVEPAHVSLTMDHASRIRFGKTFPIEWNVKVKDIGRVHPEHLSKLIAYWKEHMDE